MQILAICSRVVYRMTQNSVSNDNTLVEQTERNVTRSSLSTTLKEC